jgi:hypothetical protein
MYYGSREEIIASVERAGDKYREKMPAIHPAKQMTTGFNDSSSSITVPYKGREKESGSTTPVELEEVKEYRMYSHDFPFPDGLDISYWEYKIESKAFDKYLFIIDEVNGGFFYAGNKVKQRKNSKGFPKKTLKFLLLFKRGQQANYGDIYKYVMGKEMKFPSQRNSVHRWISDLRDCTDTDEKLLWFLEPVKNEGYIILNKRDYGFCIFERLG